MMGTATRMVRKNISTRGSRRSRRQPALQSWLPEADPRDPRDPRGKVFSGTDGFGDIRRPGLLGHPGHQCPQLAARRQRNVVDTFDPRWSRRLDKPFERARDRLAIRFY